MAKINLGALVYSIKAKNREFKQRMDSSKGKIKELDQTAEQSRRNLRRWSAGVAAASAVVVAAFVKVAYETANTAEELDRLNIQTGITHDRIAALGYAAEQELASMQQLSTGVTRLTRNMQMAARGTGESAEAFEDLDVDVQNADGSLRDVEDVLMDISDRFVRMEDNATRTAHAMNIFGRSGRELVPLLSLGREGITELMEEAERLGITMDEDTVRSMREWKDTMDAVQAGLRGLRETVAADSIPILQGFADLLQQIVEGLNALPEPIRENVVQIGLLSAGLGVVTGSLGLIVSYLPRIKAGLLMMKGAFAPFVVGGAIFIGISLLLQRFSRLRTEAELAAKEITDLVDIEQTEAALSGVRREIDRLESELASLEDLETMHIGADTDDPAYQEWQSRMQEIESELEDAYQKEEDLIERRTELVERESKEQADIQIREMQRRYRAQVELGEMEAYEYEQFLEDQKNNDELTTEYRAQLAQELSAFRIEQEESVAHEIENTLEDITSKVRDEYQARLIIAELEHGKESMQYQELAMEYARWLEVMTQKQELSQQVRTDLVREYGEEFVEQLETLMQKEELSYGMRASMLQEFLEEYGYENEQLWARLAEDRDQFEREWSEKLEELKRSQTETELEELERREKEALVLAEKLEADTTDITEFFSLQRQQIIQNEIDERMLELERIRNEQQRLEDSYTKRLKRETLGRVEFLEWQKEQAIKEAEEIGAETEGIEEYYNHRITQIHLEEWNERISAMNTAFDEAGQRLEDSIEEARRVAEERADFEQMWADRVFELSADRLEVLERDRQRDLERAKEIEADKTSIIEYYNQRRLEIEADMAQERVDQLISKNEELFDDEGERINATIENLQGLKSEYEDNALAVALITQAIQDLKLELEGLDPEETPINDFAKGLVDIGMEVEDANEASKNWARDLSRGLANAIARGEDLIDVFKRMADRLAAMVIEEWLIRPMLGDLGLEQAHQGALVTTAGLIQDLPEAHQGMLIRPDERIIKAQTGERILSRDQNEAFEAGELGRREVNLFQISANDVDSFARSMVQNRDVIENIIGHSLEDNSFLKELIRKHTR